MSATVLAIAQPVTRAPVQIVGPSPRAQVAALSGPQIEALQSLQASRLIARLPNGRSAPLASIRVRVTPPAPTCTSHDCDGDSHNAIAFGGDDCNDNDVHAFPGNTEIGDYAGHDEDCDPSTIGNRDVDGDGFIDAGIYNVGGNGEIHGNDCDDTQRLVNPMQQEVPNDRDDDCDTVVDDLGWWAPGGGPYQRHS
jgi:hypothetical protein